MATYIIAQINIDNREEYANYEAGFMAIFSQYEGTMLSVEEDPQVLEGQWSYTRTVLVEFPDKEKALAWYQSDSYQKLAKHRLSSSEGNIVMIKGL